MTEINPYGYGYQTPAPAAAVEPPIDQPWYGIGFGGAMKRFFQKYATFSGRASRSEYWWSYLGINIIYWILILLLYIASFDERTLIVTAIIILAAELALFIPALAISVRRLHDSNLSGWFILVPFGIVLVGVAIVAIAVIYIGVHNINMGDSEFGFILLAIIFYYICFFAAIVVRIVLMVRSSKPEGARFDKNPSITILPPNPQPAYAQQAYTQQPIYNQQSYTQPQYDQQPPIHQQSLVQQLPMQQQPPAQHYPVQQPQMPMQQQPVQPQPSPQPLPVQQPQQPPVQPPEQQPTYTPVQ